MSKGVGLPRHHRHHESRSVPKLITSLAITGLLAASLVSCSAPAAPSCDVTAEGSQSKLIEVTGAPDKEPTVTIPAPLDTKVTERSVAITGKGDLVEPGMQATFNYVVYNATTGKKLGGTNTFDTADAIPMVIDKAHMLPGMVKTIECSTVGSRVVAIVPPADAFGADGPNVGIAATDSLVFVFDIKKVEPAPAETASPSPSAAAAEPLPTPSAWTDNVPTVKLGGDAPTVTIPKTDPPSELLLKVITAGDGDVVTEASTVTVDYQGISWDTGKIFDQSYTRGEASSFPISGVIKGFGAAMVGQKVGATLLVTIPPTLAYGTDPAAHELGGQTLVFLIQIRAVA